MCIDLQKSGGGGVKFRGRGRMTMGGCMRKERLQLCGYYYVAIMWSQNGKFSRMWGGTVLTHYSIQYSTRSWIINQYIIQLLNDFEVSIE